MTRIVNWVTACTRHYKTQKLGEMNRVQLTQTEILREFQRPECNAAVSHASGPGAFTATGEEPQLQVLTEKGL